ncbi:uncharacterized protein [Oryza sativa Japonica Group]|uniref:Os07g0671100 protein n=3 Tax=Oryza sativa TaxID=4530 RepID=B9FUT4_ORYSJ|nr:uncharacterized protein LOC4344244 isoform X1 [Oryza sativa Japonica Group]EEC82662.1 hypothetical protein OsI_27285 [Oryza sativa Indica Group]KAB8106804.1 hypothetical protein EE612_041306 [Oryza sativa]EEE67791.1 hypothetical protein OsJ_25527 [Oryza sativa Japonica Group]KAF2924439.1 hypothetical protein DAI22_07g268700 [Oryza sativa Japonica Group]BAT03153.1 Os07g0671100 [Oryza sativa Japonica Group]
MAEPPPLTAPAPAPATPPRLAGFEQLDARIKELTSSQGELLDRIQKLKLEVQNWRSNLETQVKTSQNELLELKKGLNSEVELLKSVSLFLFHILALFVLILRSYCSWFWHMILGNEGNQVCNSGGKGHFTDSVCRYREEQRRHKPSPAASRTSTGV